MTGPPPEVKTHGVLSVEQLTSANTPKQSSCRLVEQGLVMAAKPCARL